MSVFTFQCLNSRLKDSEKHLNLQSIKEEILHKSSDTTNIFYFHSESDTKTHSECITFMLWDLTYVKNRFLFQWPLIGLLSFIMHGFLSFFMYVLVKQFLSIRGIKQKLTEVFNNLFTDISYWHMGLSVPRCQCQQWIWIIQYICLIAGQQSRAIVTENTKIPTQSWRKFYFLEMAQKY